MAGGRKKGAALEGRWGRGSKSATSCTSSVPAPQELDFRVPLDPAELQYQVQDANASLLQGSVYSFFKIILYLLLSTVAFPTCIANTFKIWQRLLIPLKFCFTKDSCEPDCYITCIFDDNSFIFKIMPFAPKTCWVTKSTISWPLPYYRN